MRPGIIYIAGTGRSGSTLLELLLNAHSRMVGLGEVHHWPQLSARGRCGCGASVRECSFWERVSERVDPSLQPAPRLDHFSRAMWTGKAAHDVLRARFPRLVSQLRSAETEPLTRRMIDRYGENTAEILKACAAVWREMHGRTPDWWIDASKDPFRLWWLLESGRFRIKVVHLLRDARAYTYSTAIRDPASRSGYGRWRAIVTRALAWRLKNALIEEVLQRKAAPADRCSVRYEHLCRDPEGELRRICETVGCRFEDTMIRRFRKVVSHSVAGNYMRFDERPIRLDEHWRSAFPRHEQWLAWSASRLPAGLIEWSLRFGENQSFRAHVGT